MPSDEDHLSTVAMLQAQDKALRAQRREMEARETERQAQEFERKSRDVDPQNERRIVRFAPPHPSFNAKLKATMEQRASATECASIPLRGANAPDTPAMDLRGEHHDEGQMPFIDFASEDQSALMEEVDLSSQSEFQMEEFYQQPRNRKRGKKKKAKKNKTDQGRRKSTGQTPRSKHPDKGINKGFCQSTCALLSPSSKHIHKSSSKESGSSKNSYSGSNNSASSKGSSNRYEALSESHDDFQDFHEGGSP